MAPLRPGCCRCQKPCVMCQVHLSCAQEPCRALQGAEPGREMQHAWHTLPAVRVQGLGFRGSPPGSGWRKLHCTLLLQQNGCASGCMVKALACVTAGTPTDCQHVQCR